MSELRTNRIVPRDGLPSGSAGGIIQVRSTTLTTNVNVTIASGANTTFYDVSGLSVSITPTRSDSKVLVMVQMNIGTDQATQRVGVRLRRDSTTIGASTETGNSNVKLENESGVLTSEFGISASTTIADWAQLRFGGTRST